MRHVSVVVIGGGCAGLACASTLKKNGIDDVVLLEKDDEVGGILNQCIHNGFGLTTFKEQLSGPAFAERFADEARALNVEIKSGAMVVSITEDKKVSYESQKEGYVTLQADAIILTVGCYERNRGAVQIDGMRCAGVFTAGQAQRYINIEGYMVGKRVFILGSGDIGLIMARRMMLEGAEVLGVAEIMPYSNGLARNIKQCLEDFNIPLYLSHTITHIYGKDRVEGIDVCKVDEHMRPIEDEKMHFDVDTVLLSIGLIPENHLADSIQIQMDPKIKGPVVDENFMTSVPGIFAAGNGLHVHDLADYAAKQGNKAAEGCVRYLKQTSQDNAYVNTNAGNDIGYVVPARLHQNQLPKIVEMYFRVKKPIRKGTIVIKCGDEVIRSISKENLVPSEMKIIPVVTDLILEKKQDVTISVEDVVYA